MSEDPSDFERLLGHAALRLWSELPREVQEKLFEYRLILRSETV